MMKKLRFFAIPILLLAFLAVYPAFGNLTCANSERAVEAFLEEWNQQELTLLKHEQEGRMSAVLYENEAGQLGINIFERKLLGLRLKHDGMNLYDRDNGLHVSGSWTEGGIRGSRCDVVICGDNRSGEVGSYVMWDAKEVSRDALESDYILDIYVLDGIAHLPKGLQLRAPDGSIFVNER